MTDVRVTFSAQDQATDVARKLLDTMRALEREQRAAASSTAALAKPAQDAATAFTQMQVALGKLGRSGSDLGAISKGVALLSDGLKSASTSAQSLSRLQEAEDQFKRALASGNITLEERIELERGLRQVQAAIAAPANAAAAALDRQQKALAGTRGAGIDAVSKRVTVLADGLRNASTRAESLTRLTAAEGQLQQALSRGNLSLGDRIRLERELRNVRGAIAGANPVDVPESAIDRAQRFHSAIVAIAVALGAVRLIGFAKDAVDAADGLNDLSKTTGVSVESLSVLTKEAEKAGASTESVRTGFRNLARSVEQLRAGNTDAVESFRAIGITAKDLRGLSLDQVLVRIADAQARFADGSGKAAVATRIFGRSGDELIPLLNELANGGFARATEATKELGGVLSTQAARSADEFNDALSNLRTALGGFANETVGALGPLSDLLNSITAFLAKIPPGVKAFAAGALIAGAAATALAGAVGALVIAFGALATVTGVGVIVGAIAAIALAAGGLATAFRSAREEKERLLEPLNKDSVLAGLAASGALGSGNITLQDPAKIKALRQARLQAARQQARDEASITDAGLKETAQLEEARFAQGLSSLREYYQNRAEIAKQGTANEVRVLESEKAALIASPLAEDTQAARVERTREIATLEAKIAVTKQNGGTALLGLVEQERVARKNAFEEAQRFQQQLFELQGDGLKAQQIQIEQSAERFARVLSSLGVDSSVVSQLRSSFSTILTDRAAFDQQQRAAQLELNGLALDRARIEQQVATGQISQRQGMLAIAAAERARIKPLQDAANRMAAFAERVGDPALKDAAAVLTQQISGLGVVIDQAKLSAVNLKDSLIDAGQSAFADFLGSGINQAKSGLDALIGLAKSLAQSFQRIGAQVLSDALFSKIRGALDGRGLTTGAVAVGVASKQLSGSGGILLTAASALGLVAAQLSAAATQMTAANVTSALSSSPLGFAGGGVVRGPGTGTSDSILARLSAGEYVIRAAAVRALGVEYLNALNGLRTPRVRSLDSVGVPRFAEGGLVVEPKVTQTATIDGTLRIAVESSEDHVVRILESPRGVKTQARNVAQNPRLFGRG